jgi:CRP-like cAMP-binding protein
MGAQKPVAELCDGAFFGEMAVITNQPRSATVVARGQLAVLKIPKQTVLEVLKDYPKVKEIIAKIGVARTEDTMDKMLED